MSLKILNEPDMDRELKRLAASAHSPVVGQWLQTVVKAYLLNSEGEEQKENFRPYDPAIQNRLHGDPPLLADLPEWAKAALERGEALHWFDPIQIYRRETWKRIKKVAVWMNSFPSGLSFEDADRRAELWAKEVGFLG